MFSFLVNKENSSKLAREGAEPRSASKTHALCPVIAAPSSHRHSESDTPLSIHILGSKVVSYFSVAAVTNHHKLGGLGQQEFILSQFWRPEAGLCFFQRL